MLCRFQQAFPRRSEFRPERTPAAGAASERARTEPRGSTHSVERALRTPGCLPRPSLRAPRSAGPSARASVPRAACRGGGRTCRCRSSVRTETPDPNGPASRESLSACARSRRYAALLSLHLAPGTQHAVFHQAHKSGGRLQPCELLDEEFLELGLADVHSPTTSAAVVVGVVA